MLLNFAVLLLSIVAQASAATLMLKSPRFVVADSIGTSLRAEALSLTQKVQTPIKLDSRDILKVTFQVLDEEGKGVQPHQTFIRFYDATTGEEGVQPVKVGQNGKAKFELNLQKPPLYLPPTGDAPLQASLIIGTPNYDPISAHLFDVVLPRSQPAPVHPDEVTFHPRPALHHTFRPEQKLPPKFISFVFAGISLAPWAVLLGLWSQVAPSPSRLFSPKVFPFVASLGAFEVLLFWYWVDLKLGQVLLYGGILAVPTLFAGKQALSNISAQRTGK